MTHLTWLDFHKLGVEKRKERKLTEALAFHLKALQLNATEATLWSSLGNVYKDMSDFDLALKAHNQAINLHPNQPSFHHNRAICFLEFGYKKEALLALERAKGVNVTPYEIEWDRCLTLLDLGRYEEAWELYELRVGLEKVKAFPKDWNLWKGPEQKVKTLLVHCEQGFGDSIQCLRFLPLLKDYSDKIYLVVQEALHSVVKENFEVDRIFKPGDKLPEFEAFIPMMSLPNAFKISKKDINGKAYIQHSSAKAKGAVKRLNTKNSNKKIGIVWSGSTSFSYNHRRRAFLDDFVPLLELKNTELYSFQKEEPLKELESHVMNDFVVELGSKLDSFADTITVLKEMDAVVMTDSALAHLAGAMGVKVHLMLACRHDWRWGEDLQSKWYESITCYRQKMPGDWKPVMKEIVETLNAEPVQQTVKTLDHSDHFFKP